MGQTKRSADRRLSEQWILSPIFPRYCKGPITAQPNNLIRALPCNPLVKWIKGNLQGIPIQRIPTSMTRSRQWNLEESVQNAQMSGRVRS